MDAALPADTSSSAYPCLPPHPLCSPACWLCWLCWHWATATAGPALDALLADVHNLYMASDDDPQRAAGMLNLYRYGYYS